MKDPMRKKGENNLKVVVPMLREKGKKIVEKERKKGSSESRGEQRQKEGRKMRAW